jgi:hypothetical protein
MALLAVVALFDHMMEWSSSVAAVRFENRHGASISSTAEWGKLAGPANPTHWVDDRSAKCLAEAWIERDSAKRLARLLARSDGRGLDGFVPEVGTAEAQTAFDEFRGGRRNHDLLVRGKATAGRVVVGVEGKGDEPFGATLGEQKRKAASEKERNPRSKAVDRINGLIRAVAPDPADAELDHLRYQLFTATAGTLAAAREAGAETCVFCVEEFATAKTDAERRSLNAADLRLFVEAVFSTSTPEGSNWVIGPFRVGGSAKIPSEVDLWVAHMSS